MSDDRESKPDFIGDFTLFILSILKPEIEANVAVLVCCTPAFGPIIARSDEDIVPMQVLRRLELQIASGRCFLGIRPRSAAKINLTYI